MREVVIDDEPVPIARVKNQTLLDTLLDMSLINVKEHMAGEYVAGQCLKAGIHVKAINFDGMPCGGGDHKNHYNGLLPLRRTLMIVREKYGHRAASVLVDAVASDMLAATNLRLLRQCLGLVSDQRLTASGFQHRQHCSPDRG